MGIGPVGLGDKWTMFTRKNRFLKKEICIVGSVKFNGQKGTNKKTSACLIMGRIKLIIGVWKT